MIAVSHPDRQHVHRLLSALNRAGLLEVFYTLVAAKGALSTLPGPWQKRGYEDLADQQIRHFPLLKILEKALGADPYTAVYPTFDRLVARNLRRRGVQVLVTYENANRESMRAAKKRGLTTVLDLAAVHHQHQRELYAQYADYRSLYPGEAYFERMCRNKEAALAHTDYVCCLSEYARQTVVETGFTPEKVLVHRLGVDHAVFFPKKEATAPRPLQIVYTGRMSRLKGLSVLEKALRNFPPQAVQCTLIGPKGDYPVDRLPQGMQYVPAMPHHQLAAALRTAHLFVSPAYTDAWAQTAVEAMATGTPVVLSDHTGAAELLRRGGGMVVPAGNATALAEAINRYVEQPDLLQEQGRRAHEAAQACTWTHYGDQVVGFFRGLLR